jgi:peptide/nickel transport system substrate-binding protein
LPKRVLLLLGAVVMLLAGCAGGGASTGPVDESVLRIAAGIDNDSFDPAQLSGGQKDNYWQAVYDTVLKLDYATQEPKPNLATSFEYDTTKTRLTLTIRDDVKFSDGSALDADAVAKNILRLRDGKGPNGYMAANVAGAVATDATTAVISFKQVDPAFLGYLTTTAGAIGNPKFLGDASLGTTPQGSGPYVLDKAATTPGDTYVFTRNPYYWNKADFPFDSVVIKPIVEMSARLNALKSGQVQGAIIETSAIEAARATDGLAIKAQATDWRGLMLADRNGTKTPALADVRVRQAINYALDGSAYLDALEQGNGTPSGQIFLPDAPGYVEALDKRYPYDPAKARELLAEAGYADGFDLVLPAFDYRSTVQPVMVQQLADVGIRAIMEPVVPDLYNTTVRSGKFSAWWIQLTSGDAWRNVEKNVPKKASWNAFRVEDPKALQLMETARAAYGDDAAYRKAMGDVSTYLVEQAYYAPWYRIDSFYVTSGGLDFTFSPWATAPELRTFRPGTPSGS